MEGKQPQKEKKGRNHGIGNQWEKEEERNQWMPVYRLTKEKIGNQGEKEKEKGSNQREEEKKKIENQVEKGSNQREEEKIGNQVVEEGVKKMDRNHRKKEKKKEKTKKIDDMLRMIFESLVSSKSDIARCRCVCKKWRSLLSTREFIRAHLQNHQVTIDDYKVVILTTATKKLVSRTDSFKQTLPPLFNYGSNDYFKRDSRDAICFIASVDGLVCAQVGVYGWEDLVLMNPLTRSRKSLPPIPSDSFYPTIDPLGFYFDTDNNDYKLLCVPNFGIDGAFVYSQRSDSWKNIELSVSEVICWSQATFFCQCLYFEVARKVIVRFDVKTETFKEIPLPARTYKPDGDYLPFVGLVVLNGCLHMYVSYNISDENDAVDVWRMKDDDDDDDDGWESVKAFTLGMDQEKETSYPDY